MKVLKDLLSLVGERYGARRGGQGIIVLVLVMGCVAVALYELLRLV